MKNARARLYDTDELWRLHKLSHDRGVNISEFSGGCWYWGWVSVDIIGNVIRSESPAYASEEEALMGWWLAEGLDSERGGEMSDIETTITTQHGSDEVEQIRRELRIWHLMAETLDSWDWAITSPPYCPLTKRCGEPCTDDCAVIAARALAEHEIDSEVKR